MTPDSHGSQDKHFPPFDVKANCHFSSANAMHPTSDSTAHLLSLHHGRLEIIKY